jgi:MazG family protein
MNRRLHEDTPEGPDGSPNEDAATAAVIARLLAIMAALRDPDRGCPWDIEQTFATIAPYTIEEAYEVADAIERGDMHDLKDELGDLLLQVVYHARMAEEEGHFAFPDVAKAISDKLIRRHPHVFGDKSSVSDALPIQWEAIKKAEREEKAAKLGRASDTSLFQGIPAGLPALFRSAKLQRRAARIGFDWPSLEPLLEKVDEEWAELRAEIATPETPEIQKRRFEEFGDLMFVLVNLGLHLGIDAEAALRAANLKFVRRMSAMEDEATAKGSRLEDMTIEELEQLWQNAKVAERNKNDTPAG